MADILPDTKTRANIYNTQKNAENIASWKTDQGLTDQR